MCSASHVYSGNDQKFHYTYQLFTIKYKIKLTMLATCASQQPVGLLNYLLLLCINLQVFLGNVDSSNQNIFRKDEMLKLKLLAIHHNLLSMTKFQIKPKPCVVLCVTLTLRLERIFSKFVSLGSANIAGKQNLITCFFRIISLTILL